MFLNLQEVEEYPILKLALEIIVIIIQLMPIIIKHVEDIIVYRNLFLDERDGNVLGLHKIQGLLSNTRARSAQ